MHVRVAASAYTARHLTSEWQLTSMAALRAARTCPYPLLAVGNAVLTTTDFIATLVVETAVHYLDLTVGIASAPAADPASLVPVRRVLDGLLGSELSGLWDDSTYALKGTDRLPVTAPQRAMLGAAADKFPLFGKHSSHGWPRGLAARASSWSARAVGIVRGNQLVVSGHGLLARGRALVRLYAGLTAGQMTSCVGQLRRCRCSDTRRVDLAQDSVQPVGSWLSSTV
jgi:hypothetical protein